MITKEKLNQTISDLPDRFSLDTLMEKLILIDKIDKGNLHSEQGQTISEEELDIEIQKWFK
jgi:hypothetical protein